MSKRARIFYRFLAATLSSFLALGCCEAFLRYTMPFSVPLGTPGIAGRAAIVDRAGRYLFSYNRRGFRTGEFSDQAAPGVTRIVVCGDSHTFGWGVNDGKRLTDYLSADLATKLSRPIEVLNLAQPSSSFPDYQVCAENASALGATALIVVVYAGNDFGETVARGVPRKGSSLRPNAPLRGRDFLRTFYLWHLPVKAFAYFSKPSEFLTGEGGCQARVALADWGPFWQALFQACVLRDHQTLETSKAAAAKAVERVVTSAGCPVLVALLPSRLMTHQTDAVEQANRVGSAFSVDAASAASLEAELSRNFLEISRQRTPYVIDLTPTVADAPDAYFPIDWHLSERGHEVVGEALAAKVAAVLEEK
ncbi:MAG: hypothetical protein ACREEM_13575 [Blastocatellia bacterium]